MPRGAKRDAAATKAAHFLDRRSFISTAGGEYLYGRDMSARRLEVLERSRMYCEDCGAWLGKRRGEVDHKKPRGGGGDESLENLQYLCGPCHRRKHP